MNVISRRKLREFCQAKPERIRHLCAFEGWFRLARRARWRSFQDCKATFGQTDIAKGATGKTATLFDIGGNKYRIAAAVDYMRQTVLIKAVMDHEEYDKGAWKKQF